jgi:transcription elongation factor Elf1
MVMEGFEYKNGELICKKCGSRNVSVRAGMMVDRAICNNCGNEDYI